MASDGAPSAESDGGVGAGRGRAPGQRAAVVVGRPPQAGLVGRARGLGPGSRIPRRAGRHRLDPRAAGLGIRPAGLGVDDRRAHPGFRQHAMGHAQPGAADPWRDHPQPGRHPGAHLGRPGFATARPPPGPRGDRVRPGSPDLDIFASGAPDPARVDLAISRSPGLVPAASFGRSGFGEQPIIDLYRVDSAVDRVRPSSCTTSGPWPAVRRTSSPRWSPARWTRRARW